MAGPVGEGNDPVMADGAGNVCALEAGNVCAPGAGFAWAVAVVDPEAGGTAGPVPVGEGLTVDCPGCLVLANNGLPQIFSHVVFFSVVLVSFGSWDDVVADVVAGAYCAGDTSGSVVGVPAADRYGMFKG